MATEQGAPQVEVEVRVVQAGFDEAGLVPEQLGGAVAGGLFAGVVDVVDGAAGVGDEDDLGGVLVEVSTTSRAKRCWAMSVRVRRAPVSRRWRLARAVARSRRMSPQAPA